MDIKKIAGGALSVLFCVGGWLAYRHFTTGGGDASAVTGSSNDAAKPTGSFKATGGALGAWEMAVTGCVSGEKNHFDGVILYDKADKSRHLRLVRARGGKYDVLVQLSADADAVLVPKCKTEATIEKTGTNVNFHDELRGTVKLACANLTGSATFPSCY